MGHIPGRLEGDCHDEHGNHRVPLVREVYDPHLRQMVVPGRALDLAERRLKAHLRAHAAQRPAPPVQHLSEAETREEVELWGRGATDVICDQAAQTIASWFQTPAGRGAEFATLATTGQCPPGLAAACTRELDEYPHDDPNREALEALRAYATWQPQPEEDT